MAIDLTDAMRDAVHVEDCDLLGHQFDYTTMTSGASVSNPNNPNGYPVIEVKGPEDGMLPYLSCKHCGMVWIVFPDPGPTYIKAFKKLKKRLVHDDPLLGMDEKERTFRN